MCNSPNWPPELAQRVAEACALRTQFPNAQTLLAILQSVGGLPGLVSQLETNLTSVCRAVNFIRPVSLAIPAETVDFPLGIGTVTTFSGYSGSLFPGLGQVC